MYRHVPWFAVGIVALLLGAAWLAPVQPTHATSDSMSPQIEAGDLYFVYETRAVSTGDVITFESTEGEGYVTHRVVAHSSAGFVTKGDANPTTDQAAGTPAVPRSAVVGEVIAVAGSPLVVPGAGAAARRIQPYRTPLLALGLAIALLVLGWGGRQVDTRDVLYVNDLVVPLLVGGLLAGGLLLAAGASTHGLSFVATEGNPTQAGAVPVGESVVRSVTVDVYRPPMTSVFVDTEGVRVLERSIDGSSLDLSVRLPAVEQPGPYSGLVHVYAYPSTLPRGVLAALHEVHWLAAAVGSMLPVFGPLTAGYLLFLDGGEPLRGGLGRWRRRLRMGGL